MSKSQTTSAGSLTCHYRGVDLKIEVGDSNATLLINNMPRESREMPPVAGRFRLTSTVQIDYEWHEFVEAELVIDGASAQVVLKANNQVLLQENLARESLG